MGLQAAVLAGALAFFPPQPPQIVEVGTILKASATRIQVRTPARSVDFRVDPGTEIYSDAEGKGVAALRTGDLVSVRGVKNAAGVAVATAISVRQTAIRGSVRRVDRGAGEVLVSPSTARADGTRTIRYYPCTVFGASEDAVNPGAEILVVGLEFRDGGVDAARITIYHTDLPVRSPRSPR